MYVHRTRQTHYEDYREFFSILASGDRTQYARAQQVLPPSPPSSPTSPIFPPRSWSSAQNTEAVYDSLEESDDSSATAVEIVIPNGFKNSVETVDALIEEVPRVRAAVVHSPVSPPASPFDDAPTTPLLRVDDVPPIDSSLAALESSASAATTSNEELRTDLKQLLPGLYDIDSFRGAVREVLKESEAAFQPLKGSSVPRPTAAAPAAAGSILAHADDKPTHMPKKRCLAQASTPADGEAGFKGAQRLMDVVSSLMTAHRPGWKKLKKSFSKSWPKPKSAKKRVYTGLGE